MRTVAIGIVSNTVGVLPAFLLGGLARLVEEDLRLGSAGLGVVTAAFFGTSAVFSVLGGRLSERFGAVRSIRLGALLSALSLVALGTLSHDWVAVLLALCLAGAGNGIASPATNLAFADGLPSRLGLAFGAKQAAVPLAALVAGLTVPSLGLAIGWRATFTVAATSALAVWALSVRLPVRHRDRTSARRRESGMASLALLTVGGAVTAAGANATTVFLVVAVTSAGVTVDRAGLLLAVGSALAVAARMTAGLLADGLLRRLVLPAVVVMMVLGAVGWLLLSTGGAGLLLVLGTVAAFTFGWGWTGLYTFAVVHRHPGAAGSATGITQAGIFFGGMAGPLIFGAIAQHHSFGLAWTTAAVLALAGAALVAASHGRRSRA